MMRERWLGEIRKYVRDAEACDDSEIHLDDKWIWIHYVYQRAEEYRPYGVYAARKNKNDYYIILIWRQAAGGENCSLWIHNI